MDIIEPGTKKVLCGAIARGEPFEFMDGYYIRGNTRGGKGGKKVKNIECTCLETGTVRLFAYNDLVIPVNGVFVIDPEGLRRE